MQTQGTIYQAKDIVKQELAVRGEMLSFIKFFNRQRHCKIDTTKNQYYVIFKRKMYMTFGRQFGQSGTGESINLVYLKQAAREKRTILVCYNDGKIYHIPAIEWLEYAYQNNLIRTQNGGEKTASIPVRKLARWN